MKLYFGGPNQPPCVGEDGKKRRLPRPTGTDGKLLNFAWGIDSMDSARLAFAILRDALGNDIEPEKYYMMFKRNPVLTWKADKDWAISEAEVLQCVQRIRDAHKDAAMASRHQEVMPIVFEGGSGVGVSDHDFLKTRR